MERQFKVGDKVRVRSGLESGFSYGGYIAVGVVAMAGEELTIKSPHDDGAHHWRVEESPYLWREEWFEPVNPTVSEMISDQQAIITEATETILRAKTAIEALSANRVPEPGDVMRHKNAPKDFSGFHILKVTDKNAIGWYVVGGVETSFCTDLDTVKERWGYV